jgi:ArsR family transcriptional regulator
MKAATDKLSLALRAVADPTRRKILRLLRSKPGTKGLCASQVEQRIKLAQPTVSHHMKILKQAGLVETTKLGTWVYYKRNEAALRRMRTALSEEI